MSISLDNMVEKAFDNFKKITPLLVAIAILTGMLLFLPKSILAKMGLDVLPVLWKRFIGIVFLLSVTLIITLLTFSVISLIRKMHKNKRAKANLKKKYKTLSPRHKDIILQLLRSENKAIRLDKNSGDTVYLVNNYFIHMPSQPVIPGWNNELILTYVPQLWLLDLYYKEPELFK